MKARKRPARRILSALELAALGLAHRDAAGRWNSRRGTSASRRALRWEAGEGARDTLDANLAKLREAHADITPAYLSAILNRKRAPGISLAFAFERAFNVPMSWWALARVEEADEGGQLAVDRDSERGSAEVARMMSEPHERGGVKRASA